MSSVIAVAADLLVAVLLAATIVTSLRLSRRIRGLKADEAAMRTTVAELVTVIATAERAVGGLRATLADSEKSLAGRIREAQDVLGELDGRTRSGRAVLDCIGQIAEISGRAGGPSPAGRAGNPASRDRPSRADALRETGSALDAILARLSRDTAGRAA